MSKDEELDRLAHDIYLKEMKRMGAEDYEVARFNLFKAAHDYSTTNIKKYYDIASRILKLKKIKKKLSDNKK
jgi:hypothetical protein